MIDISAKLNLRADCTLIVLDDGEVYQIETGLLKHTSQYFYRLFQTSGSWIEMIHGICTIEGFDAMTFEVFKYWLHTGDIEFMKHQVQNLWSKGPEGEQIKGLVSNNEKVWVAIRPPDHHELDLLNNCYILADYLMLLLFTMKSLTQSNTGTQPLRTAFRFTTCDIFAAIPRPRVIYAPLTSSLFDPDSRQLLLSMLSRWRWFRRRSFLPLPYSALTPRQVHLSGLLLKTPLVADTAFILQGLLTTLAPM